MNEDNEKYRKEYELYLLSALSMDIAELIDTRWLSFEEFVSSRKADLKKESEKE